MLDRWPLDLVDASDPRVVKLCGQGWDVLALTSLSWLLPVELSPDGRERLAIHYDKAIAPAGDWQCYGIEDPRISRVGDDYWMTTCSVSPERHSTTLYHSTNGLDWRFVDIVLDHQNKDMLIFEGRIDGHYWAQTRPLGDVYFAYPPGSAMARRAVDQPRHLARCAALEARAQARHSPARRRCRDRARRGRGAADPDRFRLADAVARGRAQWRRSAFTAPIGRSSTAPTRPSCCATATGR